MLSLQHITKIYKTDSQRVEALKGVSVAFRDCEFVSILGPSGCGKTTLLNIIGGLDQYTSGDLSINGRSTKKFKSRDWDAYRNHSIGFVFQSYNLIPHQTVLANVELALTLSGVSKAERRKRAIAVLEKVGLGDQLHKKPLQMSGGQMQRVAIARALINDPDILLADEPTGALDTETSVQIMNLLQEVARDRLVVMVTHNPELAAKYSTRIVRLLDGKIIDDSNPFDPAAQPAPAEASMKRTSMSFFTALSLSLTNLMTKKGRTILTAFAGSIGIIGIALILSLSSGFQNYIDRVEEDTLSSYPIELSSETMDYTELMTSMMNIQTSSGEHELDQIYVNTTSLDLMNTMISDVEKNDLAAFKTYLESCENLDTLASAVQYTYDVPVNVYTRDESGAPLLVNPSDVMEHVTGSSSISDMMTSGGGSMMNFDVWCEMLDNQELLDAQYDVVTGRWPEAYNEVVLVVDRNNEISDLALYCLGIKDPRELDGMMERMMAGETIDPGQPTYSYDDFLNRDYWVLPSADFYTQDAATGQWTDARLDSTQLDAVLQEAVPLKIVGIIRPAEDAQATSISGAIGYTHALTEYLIEAANESPLVQAQLADPDTDVFTGAPFGAQAPFDSSALSDEERAYLASLSPEEQQAMIAAQSAAATYAGNLALLGVADPDVPSGIQIYPVDFASKEKLCKLIDDYNDEMSAAGHEESVISYTDYIGLMMSSISKIIDVISYVLIAFVAISLVVSSIMIGVITNISVLERTKEIGILRAIGASKRDVSRVFNAETLIIGFISGVLGILVTVLLCIPINALIYHLGDIKNVAALPVGGGIILLLISMALTFIAGLVPSHGAAKKDPVVALRSE